MMRSLKVPEILQEETYECGLASVAAIAQSHGIKISLAQLRGKYEITAAGLTIRHILKIYSEVGIVARGVRLDYSDLKKLTLPAIILWNKSHFVVLTKLNSSSVEVMDPATGNRHYSNDEAAEFFSKIAIETTSVNKIPGGRIKSEDDKQKNENLFVYNFKSFIDNWPKYGKFLYPLLILSICVNVVGIATPKFVSLVLDEVLQKNDQEFLDLLLYIFFVIYVIEAASNYFKNIVQQRFRVNLSIEQGSRVISSLMNMPLRYFSHRSPANIIRRIRTIDQIHVMYTHGYVEIGVASIFTVVFLLLMYSVNTKLCLLVGISGAAFVLLRNMLIPRYRSLITSSIDWEVRRDTELLEAIKSIHSLKLYKLAYIRVSNWISEHVQLNSTRVSMENIGINLNVINHTLAGFQNLAIMYIGAKSIMSGDGTVGALVGFIFYKDFFMRNLETMVQTHIGLQLSQVETSRLREIIPNDVESISKENVQKIHEADKLIRIELENIYFGYTSLDEPLLKGVTISFEYGKKVAIMGPSGSGKSTLINIISGLYLPNQGRVLYNSINATNNPAGLLSQVAVVSGNDEIIDGTIIDNILYGAIDVDNINFERCISDSGMSDVVKNLPHGLNTQLGAAGQSLSSGQKQRLLIARGLYKNPSFLILDEPTSHLDEETASEISSKLLNLPIGVLVVTHDLKLGLSCDQRYWMSHNSLIEVDKEYIKLIQNKIENI